MSNVVVVVDMCRGFLEDGHPLSCGQPARRIIPHVQRLLDEELAKGSPVLFVNDAHLPEDPEIATGLYPPHCMKGTVEAEVIPELASYLARGEFFEKHAYSGFTNAEFEARVRELAPERVIVVGVCTDICVLHTAADAFFRGYALEAPEECVASFSEENHRFGLAHLRNALGAKDREAAPTGATGAGAASLPRGQTPGADIASPAP
ncbi:MAG: isochorismatase family cysteine hydrolase [Dehalococcoidia bacterium]